jgi:hypothetical protein
MVIKNYVMDQYEFNVALLVKKQITDEEKNRLTVEIGKKIEEILGKTDNGTVSILSKPDS